MRQRFLSLAFGALGVICFSGSVTAASETGLSPGKLFPDLVLPALSDGQLKAVSSFRGKKTLLVVFASW